MRLRIAKSGGRCPRRWCTGGRIVDHLKAGITDRKNDIFFVGYQAKGTPGRDIVRYSQRPGGYVYLDNKKFNIKAKVHTLSGYSAHADQKGLIEWVESMPERPGRIKLVHGEAGAQRAIYIELGAVSIEKIHEMNPQISQMDAD